MFGLSKTKDAAKAGEQEAKERKIEALKQSLSGSIDQMAPFVEAGNTEKCEAVVERLKTTSMKNPLLPGDFRKLMQDRLDNLLRDAFMKAADIAVSAAQRAAMADNRETRDKKIKEAREKLAGAVRMKAPAEFKSSCERAIENASLSGGIKKDGPTKAKPADFAPKTTKQAKPDAAYYKAIEAEEIRVAKEAEEARLAKETPKGDAAKDYSPKGEAPKKSGPSAAATLSRTLQNA
jgi:hypothetical protein